VGVGQVQQHHVSGGPLDERADRRLVLRAGDEVTLPVSRDRPVFDLGGTLADVDHAGDPAATVRGLAAGFAQ
jgi:hypothetical protein